MLFEQLVASSPIYGITIKTFCLFVDANLKIEIGHRVQNFNYRQDSNVQMQIRGSVVAGFLKEQTRLEWHLGQVGPSKLIHIKSYDKNYLRANVKLRGSNLA